MKSCLGLKTAMLALAALAGSLFNASCTMGDFRDSMVTGLLGYVKTSTTDVFTGFLPSWKEWAKNAASS